MSKHYETSLKPLAASVSAPDVFQIPTASPRRSTITRYNILDRRYCHGVRYNQTLH